MGEVPSGITAEALGRRERDAEEYLARLAAGLQARGIDVTWKVRSGHVADAIASTARATGADVIAMSTHGRSGLGRLLFGSVAEQVLRQADVPVLLLRQTEAPVTAYTAKELAR
jgi:nucleotide-binding universal stress UspA family protein